MKELHYTTSVDPLPVLQVVDKLDNRYIIQDSGEEVTLEGVKVRKQLIVILENALTYSNVISAIIDAKYSADDVTAITLNYLLVVHNQADEDKSEEYLKEYEAFQKWRKSAKEIAKDVIAYAESEGIEVS